MSWVIYMQRYTYEEGHPILSNIRLEKFYSAKEEIMYI